jgi:AcrR family transcriptional regulator
MSVRLVRSSGAPAGLRLRDVGEEPMQRAEPRRRNRRGHGDQLRADLVAAASRLLESLGSEEALSLRAVARQAGVAPPSVYLHFADKHELMRAVLDERFVELREMLDEAGAAATDPVGDLRARCITYCTFAEEQYGNYSVMFSAMAVAQPGVGFEELPGSEVFLGLVGAVERCVRSGAIGALDVFLTSSLIWTNLHGLATLRHSKPAFPWPPLTVLLEEMLRGYCGIGVTATERARVG